MSLMSIDLRQLDYRIKKLCDLLLFLLSWILIERQQKKDCEVRRSGCYRPRGWRNFDYDSNRNGSNGSCTCRHWNSVVPSTSTRTLAATVPMVLFSGTPCPSSPLIAKCNGVVTVLSPEIPCSSTPQVATCSGVGVMLTPGSSCPSAPVVTACHGIPTLVNVNGDEHPKPMNRDGEVPSLWDSIASKRIDRRVRTEDRNYAIVFASQPHDSKAGVPTGHAFIVWEREDDGKQMTVGDAIGFRCNPDCSKIEMLFGAPGVLSTDAGKPIDNKLVVLVNGDKYQTALEQKCQWEENGTYEALWRNCVSHVADIAKAIGLDTSRRRLDVSAKLCEGSFSSKQLPSRFGSRG